MSLDLLNVKNDYNLYIRNILTQSIDNTNTVSYDRNLSIGPSINTNARIDIGPNFGGTAYNVYINGVLFNPLPVGLTYNTNTVSLTFSGAIGPTPVTVNTVFERIGKTVSLSIPLVNNGAQAGGLMYTNTIPAIYQPSTDRCTNVLIRSSVGAGSGIVFGNLIVRQSGIIEIGVGVDLNNVLTNFSGSGVTSNALLECVIVYTI